MLPLTLLLTADIDAPKVSEIFNSSLGIGKLIWLLAIGQVLAVVAFWLSSVLFADQKATIGRAVLTHLGGVGLIIAASFVLALGVPILMKTRGPLGAVLFGGGVTLLALTPLVAIPMKLYQVGILRSLGLIFIAGIVSFLFNAILQMSIAGDEMVFNPAVAREWAIQSVPKPPPNREAQAEDLRQREAELGRRYDQLTIRYRHMPLGDNKAVTDYLKERDI